MTRDDDAECGDDTEQPGEKRVNTLDELELSVHHRIATDPLRSDEEYEIPAGHADVIEVPKRLVEAAKTVTGVDIRAERVRCGAEIRVVDE